MGTWNWYSMGWDGMVVGGGWGSWHNVNQSLGTGNLVEGTFLIYLLQWNWYYSVKRPPSQEWLCCTTTILVGESDKNPNCDLSPINSCWAVGRLLNLNGRFERKCAGWWWWWMVARRAHFIFQEPYPFHTVRISSWMPGCTYTYWNYSWSPVSSVHHSSNPTQFNNINSNGFNSQIII